MTDREESGEVKQEAMYYDPLLKRATLTDFVPPGTYEQEWGDRLVGVEAIAKRSFEDFDVLEMSSGCPYSKGGRYCVSNWMYTALQPLLETYPSPVDQA